MKIYQIYNLTTDEILADNVSSEDLQELFDAYVSFYPCEEIVVYHNDIKVKRAKKIIAISNKDKNEFKHNWYNLIDELCRFGNIY